MDINWDDVDIPCGCFHNGGMCAATAPTSYCKGKCSLYWADENAQMGKVIAWNRHLQKEDK